jgi:FdhD protein
MLKVSIVKIDVSAGKAVKETDYVAEEKPIHLFLNRTHYATIFCSPLKLGELAVGHTLSEGILKSPEEIKEISLKEAVCRIRLQPDVDLEKRLKLSRHFSRVIFSACGSTEPYQPAKKLAKIKSNITIKADVLLACVNQLNFIAETFRKTGAVHVAAIYKLNGILAGSAEDVGRHNAVDKAIGIAASKHTDFSSCFLALSGRLTGDIVMKAARVGLPMVVSMAAAIDSGVEVAKELNLTLIGFARGKRMNVYSCPERIIL